MPVFNEIDTLQEIVKRVLAVDLAHELIIVDDGSTDGTRDLYPEIEKLPRVRVIMHEKNQGKGAAVRTGIEAAEGDVLLIQDADLEYNPKMYPKLLEPLEEGLTDVVYGSRFLGGARRSILFWNMVANKLLTLLTNILYNAILTDMETGYKVFRKEIVKDIRIRARRFDFEPEITAKLLKRHIPIVEVPIDFYPRDYTEGKKIGFSDGVEALWTLFKYRFVE